MATQLELVLERFPKQSVRVMQCYWDDPEFRTICEDFEMADAAYTRWKDDPNRAQEYQEILERLTTEILERLATRQ